MAGIPVVASDHPEKRRIIETYQVGTTCDETDPRDIAEAINRVLNDEKAYRQMCRNAKKTTRETLNWSEEEKKLIDLYQRLEPET
jgi:glycosyltransferase involved in cell wall biosynthesis